jgi:hypothetical protein
VRSTKHAGARTAILAAVCALPITAAAYSQCATASTGGSLTPRQQIEKDWITFLAGVTSAQQKRRLLENGPQYVSIIKAHSAWPLAKVARVRVTSLRITSATTATVGYSLVPNDKVVLPDQTGDAVKQRGVWNVGAKRFQALLAREGQQGIPAAPSASP